MRINVVRVIQRPGHCGPACVSMMLGQYGIQVPQEAIAAAAGLTDLIQREGSRIDQLAKSVDSLLRDVALVARFNTAVNELAHFLIKYNRPIGIEWQGCFECEDGSMFNEGHYSIVNGYDTASDLFDIVDPDPRSVFRSGTLAPAMLASRWWERNVLSDHPGGEVVNRGLAFMVVRQGELAEASADGFICPTPSDLVHFAATFP